MNVADDLEALHGEERDPQARLEGAGVVVVPTVFAGLLALAAAAWKLISYLN